jgi:hypothetical protein
MATPTWVGNTAGSVTTSASWRTPGSLPTHQADDIIVVLGQVSGARTFTGPGGIWNELFQFSNTNQSIGVFWGRATGSGTASPEIDIDAVATAAETFYCIAWIIRGCVTSGTPFAYDYTGPASNTTVDCPDLNLSAGPNYMAHLVGIMVGVPSTTGYPPSGWTAGCNTSTNIGAGAKIADARRSAGAVSGVQTYPAYTISSAYHTDISFAYRDALPAGSAPPTPPGRRFQHLMTR